MHRGDGIHPHATVGKSAGFEGDCVGIRAGPADLAQGLGALFCDQGLDLRIRTIRLFVLVDFPLALRDGFEADLQDPTVGLSERLLARTVGRRGCSPARTEVPGESFLGRVIDLRHQAGFEIFDVGYAPTQAVPGIRKTGDETVAALLGKIDPTLGFRD